MDTFRGLYKKSFENYLRTGAPIVLTQKRDNNLFPQTGQYIWRIRRDSKVRSAHAVNDGKIFDWNNPPVTGHPGQEYGCRCRAIPYVQSVSESMHIALSDVHDSGPEWSSRDFLNHYWNGNGAAIALRKAGHLEKVVDAYMQIVEQRLKEQIADAAREKIGQTFFYTFDNLYHMTSVVFSLGKTTIGGLFFGSSVPKNGALEIEGLIEFYLKDEFTDPTDFGIDLPRSQDYDIYDSWKGSVRGVVSMDRAKSEFVS